MSNLQSLHLWDYLFSSCLNPESEYDNDDFAGKREGTPTMTLPGQASSAAITSHSAGSTSTIQAFKSVSTIEPSAQVTDLFPKSFHLPVKRFPLLTTLAEVMVAMLLHVSATTHPCMVA